ncbi:hypothetical protein [Kitasatospora sp. CB01950]|uniref:hypothetical protein n=1 Tax=Kitasatospora sp. CB01950 TaxID=1703930 RepID=UPI00093FB1FF|nr:hypothetical protein [Kitasatospora sp. CB01950]OKJ13562.1 hypothetical protein AMK19_08810 [Kitasatospora sp. CB01950]
MGRLLSGVAAVRWGELRDATGDPAGRVPALLSRIAFGDEQAARRAVDELADAVCALGFVVGGATAPAVPLLLELAVSPTGLCQPELWALLESICRTEQWHSAAGPEHGPALRRQLGWEAAARAAVHAGRPVVERVAASVRPEDAVPARRLLRAMDESPPFPTRRGHGR